MRNRVARKIAELAVEKREAEIAIVEVEGLWQPGDLQKVLAAYKRRNDAEVRLNHAIKEFRNA
jgi:hypothetical protein